jgi:TrbM
MKRQTITVIVASVLVAGAPIEANASDNQPACGAVLCLAGIIAGGSGGGDCVGYMRDYFSIVKFHNGHFDLAGTLNARTSFTDQCQSGDAATKKSVNDKYGTSQSGP